MININTPAQLKSGGVFIKNQSCLGLDRYVCFHLSQKDVSYPHQIRQNQIYLHFLLNDALSLILEW